MNSRLIATGRFDTVFDLLSDQRRRYLLYYLTTVEGDVVEFPAAVSSVRGYETPDDGTGDAAETRTAGGSSRDEIAIALHHDHLPRLADAAVLDYDPRQGTIRLTIGSGVEEWVEHTRSRELEWVS